MESEESETPVVKKPANTIFNYFAKPLKVCSNNELVEKQTNHNKGVKEDKEKDENSHKDDDKENSKAKPSLKVGKKKRKKREVSSSSEEDVPEEQCQKKKRLKKSGTQPNSTHISIQNSVILEAKEDKKPDVPNLDNVENPSEETVNEEQCETISIKSISNFFTKVSKKERLSIVEKESSQLKVQVMIHDSPEVKATVNKALKDETRTRKPRKSNVARSAVETDKIKVLEVTEVIDDKEESDEIEIELDTNMSTSEASEKISTKLFALKRKNTRVKPTNDESDTSINLDSLENTPVKDDSLRSPVKKTAKAEIINVKSAFSILLGGKKESKHTDDQNVIEIDSSDEHEVKKSVVQPQEAVLAEKNRQSGNAFSILMGRKGLKAEESDVLEIEVIDEDECKATDPNSSKSEEKVLEEVLEKDKVSEKKTSAANAFTFLMAKKVHIEKAEENILEVKVEEKPVEKFDNKNDDGDVIEDKLINKKNTENPKTIEINDKVKNNAFLTLMKNSRKSFEPPPEEEIEESYSSHLDKSNQISRKVPGDEKLKNMMFALQSVDSENDTEEIEEVGRNDRKKHKKKAKLKGRTKKKEKEPSPGVSEVDDDEAEVEVDIEVVGTTGDADVYEVRCRRAVGEFHLSKFISGGKGLSIKYDGSWITPNEFEKEAGSRSKKYKNSLFVNNKPIIKLLEERNVSTPSRSRSGRSTPVEELDFPTPESTPKRKGGKKKNTKRILESDDETIPEEETAEETEATEKRRSSGRIAKNLVALQEKRKEEEELERAEKELKKQRKEDEKKRKEEERNKKKEANLVKKSTGKKKRVVSSSSEEESESDSDSDCKVEEVVVKSKKHTKLASIFTGGKKAPVKPAEDPAVTAARRAFLMSSAPEALKSQISEDKSDTIPDDGVVVWPGEDTLANHTQQKDQHHLWSLNLGLEMLKFRSSNPCIKIPDVVPGQLQMREDEEKVPDLTQGTMSEADVLATLDTWAKISDFPVHKIFNSFVERKVEAESFEREAREKNLSVQEVEEKRIRGNKRRSRRSREGKGEGEEGKYVINSGSGLMWTGKYQPRSVGDMVGNSDELSRMREWLRGWVGGRSRGGGSTSETGSEWGASEAGSEFETVADDFNNTAVLEGAVGVGKSAAVYALAAEMGFNVLEVNASSFRTGKKVLAMLTEATQSQQVRREAEKSQSLFSKKEQDKTNSKKMKTALILFEDIDLVFGDLDDGFYGAVNTLSQQSKRPIVMTVSNCHWLRGDGERLLKFTPLIFTLKSVGEEELVNSLQVLALVEGYRVGKVDLRELVRECRGVRQCVLQLQVLCESGLVRGGGREESVLEGEQSKEETVDIRKWFRHIDSKTRRKGVVPDSCGLGRKYEEDSFSNVEWWESLSGVTTEVKHKVQRYPLTKGEAGTGSYSRIDPLKNKELFDTEDSETEMEVDSDKETEEVVSMKCPKSPASKAKFVQNRQSLLRISGHLDLISEVSPRVAESPWYTLPPVSDSTAQVFPEFRENMNEAANSPNYKVQALNMSEKLLKKSIENSELKIFRLEDNVNKHIENIHDCQFELFYGGLVETYMLDRVGRTELLSGMRGLARGEEHKRIAANATSRRGKSFNHYFAQNEVYLGQETLNSLCNSLVD